MRIPVWIADLFDRFEAAGEEAYLVGGCLRDALLGIPPHDYDLTTSARPERTKEICRGLRVIETGIQHGTVTVLTEGGPVEITTFRVDGAYTDSRHPDSVCFSNRVSEDLARRDFTVNAMAYHPTRGLVDLYGGREDLSRGIIRAVGDPRVRFAEDALRILRAFRFAAQLGFSIHEDTLLGAADRKAGLGRIAKERIASEFLRLLVSPSPQESIRLMTYYGILPYITGDYAPSEAIRSLLPLAPNSADARLGLYFAETDTETAKRHLRELRCSNRQITGAASVLRGASLTVASPEDAGRFRAATGDYAMDAVKVSVLLGNSPAEAEEWIRQSTAPCRVSELAVSGKDLLALGFSGKELGQTLEWLLSLAMKDPAKNRREALLSLAQERRGVEKSAGVKNKT